MIMKKQLLLLVMIFLQLVANAAVEIDGIYYYLYSNGAEVTSNPNNYTGNIVIPETFNYNDVTYSVTSIGDGAFMNCSGLTSITIPNSVTSVGTGAFWGCSGLTSVTINSNAVFSNRYTLSNNIESIFGKQVTEYIIGDSVTSISEYTFRDCIGLTSVTIGKNVTSIGESAFDNCYSLSSVILGYSVAKIGGSAFSRCSKLTSITFPNSLLSIGTWAFEDCSSLTSITIPNSVTSIGKEAFKDCSGLTSVTLNSNAIVSKAYTSSSINAFFGEQVTEYIIGDSVTSIGPWAFNDCYKLTSVIIPNSVTSIGKSAFENC